MEPVLPPELEREIFETAAHLDRSDIPTLLLVYRRVHEWIEHLLYRSITIVAHDEYRLLAVQARPAAAAFLQQNLRYLCVAYTIGSNPACEGEPVDTQVIHNSPIIHSN
ncbi:hypothetical protein R3P38DRAFT_2914725 [Favolaschia claudopus]|uniref:F-box domain-containing protein n=1 Tax=Favolaschia claudopus TaxID=2862362 RepID=A0AAW0C590_9AGAR